MFSHQACLVSDMRLGRQYVSGAAVTRSFTLIPCDFDSIPKYGLNWYISTLYDGNSFIFPSDCSVCLLLDPLPYHVYREAVYASH